MDALQTNLPPRNLQGQRVVIAGGTGSVGEGFVRSYLRADAHVIIPTRSREKSLAFLDVLGDEGKGEQLSFIVGDYTTFDTAATIAKSIEEEFGPIHHAVATIGGWWTGRTLWETTNSAWQRHFIDLSTAHLSVARAFIPRLRAGGSYHVLMVLSGLNPTAGSGIVNMHQAALIMMTRILISETAGTPRVYGQILGPVNNRNRPAERAEWISAEDAGFISAQYAANAEIAPHIIELPRKEQETTIAWTYRHWQMVCKIVFWQHDLEYENDDQVETCNSSFSDWLQEVLIGWTLEDYNYDGSLRT